ncbi:YlbG family protein [Companilactobacillus jidongensis]|uniref:YlbG family protein n=1 Tax=Companilactobacillus jidongensis TaxID=2486006 RepID=UPI000F78857F|nr:YlbG family protein [Companilactobacillus jidongensis]
MYKKVERQAMYVWVYSMKWKKKLQHFGTVHYVSPKMKYILIYVNASRAAEVKKELISKNYVKRVTMAHRKELDEHFVLKSDADKRDNSEE